MTMMPPSQMGPPRARPAADQTTSGFAYAKATWDVYFDASGSVALRSSLSGSEAEPIDFQVYTAGGLALPDVGNMGDAGVAAREFAAVAPVYVLLHGGGLSSLSWALVASALKKQGRLVLAYDFRAHGNSGGLEADCSVEQLCADTVAVVEAVIGTEAPLVIVGHSLGGAIAAKVSASPQLRERVAVSPAFSVPTTIALLPRCFIIYLTTKQLRTVRAGCGDD